MAYWDGTTAVEDRPDCLPQDEQSPWRDPRVRFSTIGAAALVVTVLAGLAIALGRTFPVKETVTQEVVKIEKVKQVVVPIPSDRTYAPLDDPKKACTGAPVVVAKLEEQKQKDETWITFIAVRPAGDEYIVNCQINGAYGSWFKPGDIVSLPKGSVSG